MQDSLSPNPNNVVSSLASSYQPGSSVPQYASSHASASGVPHSHSSPSRSQTPHVGSYRLSRTLGKGSSGKVKVATHVVTGEKYACKIIPRQEKSSGSKTAQEVDEGPETIPVLLDLATVDRSFFNGVNGKPSAYETRILREAATMLLLNHPHIVTLHEVYYSNKHYYFIFSLVNGGQILDFILAHGRLKEKNARKFMRQLTSAVEYCHLSSIVHRDLKIENVLIDKTGNIKLIDFGLCNYYSEDKQLNTFCGSLYFAAPELLNAKAYTGPEIDIWSLGVIMFVLVSGRVPFDDVSMQVLHQKIKAGQVEYPTYLSPECRHLISRMLVTNPAERATMEEVKQHTWMVKGFDGPPPNFVPKRVPPLIPLNPTIISYMRVFEFGNEDEIVAQLEREVMKQYAKAIITNQILLGSPVLSIYYLIQEKLINDSSIGVNAVAGGGGSMVAGSAVPGLSAIDTSKRHTSSFAELAPSSPATMPSARSFMVESGPSTPVPGTTRAIQSYSAVSPLGALANEDEQSGMMAFSVDANPNSRLRQATAAEKNKRVAELNGDGRENGVNRSRSQSVANMREGPFSVLKWASGTRLASVSSRERLAGGGGVTDVGSSRKQSVPRGGGDTRNGGADGVPTEGSRTTLATSLRSNRRMGSDRGTNGGTPEVGAKSPRPGRVDENIQTVQLRGLFAVLNTSTKPPAAIRESLLRSLDALRISVHEFSGGLDCQFGPSNGDAGSNYYVSPLSDPEMSPGSWSPRQSPSLRSRESNTRHLRGGSQQSRNPSIDTDADRTHCIRFEVNIVRVPLLSKIHGVRFRRISGDAWQYKKIVQDILDIVRL